MPEVTLPTDFTQGNAGGAEMQNIERLLGYARCGAALHVSETTGWAECRGRQVLVHPDVAASSPSVLAATVAHEVAHLRYHHARLVAYGRVSTAVFALAAAATALSVYGWLAALLSVLAVRFLSALVGSALLRTLEVHADWAGARFLEKSLLARDGYAAMAQALQAGGSQRVVFPRESPPPLGLSRWQHAHARARLAYELLCAHHSPLALRVKRLRHQSRMRGLLHSLRDAWLAPVTIALRDFR